MILKQIPSDFIVKEIAGYHHVEEPFYAIFLLKKVNYTTEKAVQTIANALHIKRNRIGYAGMKDKIAITQQYISIERIKKEKVLNLKLKDIELNFVSYNTIPISLGNLKGNAFEIIVRGLSKTVKFDTKKNIKNYFGEQRFSNNNDDVGRAIVKKDYKKAVGLILENSGEHEEKVESHLSKTANDYVGALRTIPRKILILYAHAYQSYLFNETIKQMDSKKNEPIPLAGFCMTIHSKILENLLKKEGLEERDFINRQIPELSLGCETRMLSFNPEKLKIGKLLKDDLNPGKYKIKFSFTLEKGSYATNIIKQIIQES